MTYTPDLPILWAIGNNNAAGLVALNPQPRWTPGKYAGVYAALSGAVATQASYEELVYDPGLDEIDWFSVMAQFGFSFASSTLSVAGTVQIPFDESGSHQNYNCTARYMADGTRKFGKFWQAKILLINKIAI